MFRCKSLSVTLVIALVIAPVASRTISRGVIAGRLAKFRRTIGMRVEFSTVATTADPMDEFSEVVAFVRDERPRAGLSVERDMFASFAPHVSAPYLGGIKGELAGRASPGSLLTTFGSPLRC